MPECVECGSRQVHPVVVDGFEVERCALCDHVQGDEEQVAGLAQRRQAEDRGLHPVVFPFVQALETVPTFRVTGASAGKPERNEFPFVFLRLAPDGLRDLERLLTSLEMANQTTKRRWVVECTLQRGLLFIVRPRFWKPVLEINQQDITEARGDLKLLAEILARDVKLSWWTD